MTTTLKFQSVMSNFNVETLMKEHKVKVAIEVLVEHVVLKKILTTETTKRRRSSRTRTRLRSW